MNEMKLNKNHDLELSGTHIARIKKGDFKTEAEQQCLCLLKCEEGEAFVDYTHGVPWFHKILGLPVQYLDVATAIIRKKLSELSAVKKVIKISLNTKGRNLHGTFKIQANDETITTGEF